MCRMPGAEQGGGRGSSVPHAGDRARSRRGQQCAACRGQSKVAEGQSKVADGAAGTVCRQAGQFDEGQPAPCAGRLCHGVFPHLPQGMLRNIA